MRYTTNPERTPVDDPQAYDGQRVTLDQLVTLINNRKNWLRSDDVTDKREFRFAKADELEYILGRLTAHNTAVRHIADG